MAGVYVHIPFCARRCIYCGFFSTVRQEEAARYVDVVCRELELRRDYLEGAAVNTIYFGGGTPSRLTSAQIDTIISAIGSTLGIENLRELTVECNPDDITPAYVDALRALGVNRISMGVQTFNDDLLRFLGRRHSAAQAISAVEICHRAGIDNVSTDLMYGLPGQTSEIQMHDLETATSLDVQHISSYCLSYEDGSPLDRLRKESRVTPVDDDTCAAMYDRMCSHLHSAGFDHYEISNFCRPGYHSRHNSSYWDATPYLGVGAAAHSYNGSSRQWNPSDLDAYLKGIEQSTPQYDIENLSRADLYNERLMLRLRTSAGLDLSTLSEQDRTSILRSAQPLIKSNSLTLNNNHLQIPESKFFISDTIISSLFK